MREFTLKFANLVNGNVSKKLQKQIICNFYLDMVCMNVTSFWCSIQNKAYHSNVLNKCVIV